MRGRNGIGTPTPEFVQFFGRSRLDIHRALQSKCSMPEEKTRATQANYDKAIEGLGIICVEFQRLEWVLKSAIALLICPNDTPVGVIVTAQLSFIATLDLLYALYHYRVPDDPPDTLKDLKKYLEKCGNAATRRNNIVHAQWMPDLKTGKGAVRTKYTAKNRNELKQQKETVSPTDMQKVSDELRSMRDLYRRDWMERIHRWERRQHSMR